MAHNEFDPKFWIWKESWKIVQNMGGRSNEENEKYLTSYQVRAHVLKDLASDANIEYALKYPKFNHRRKN